MKLLNQIEGSSPATPEELVWAYRVRERARDLGPSSREVYGNEADITLDEDALVAACIEVIREIRRGLRLVA